MATFVKLPSGSWRAVVRRMGRYISETFRQREAARRWATAAEADIDRGAKPRSTRSADKQSLAYLVELLIADLKSVGKRIGRPRNPQCSGKASSAPNRAFAWSMR